MDKSTRNGFQDTSPQTMRKLTSQLSPKRRRTDWVNSCTEMFCKTVCCPSSASALQMTADLARTDKCGVIEDEEPCGTAMIVDLIANLSASHARDAPTNSPERRPIALLTDEQPLVAEFVELCQHLQDDAGGDLAESHTSPDSCTNASNHSDCKLWRGSLEDRPPVDCNLPSGNGHELRQVVSGVCEVQVSNCSGNTWPPAEHMESFQKEDGHLFREIIPSREGGVVENSSESYTHYSDKSFFHRSIEDIPSGNLTEGVKNGREKLELQICGNGDVASCETIGNANDNGLSRSTMHCAAQCAEGSIVPYNVASVGKIPTDRAGLEDDVLCGAEGEHAAGEMIAEARRKNADHPAETLPPAGISQEHAEGDNDAGRFSVIDPAIWRETDRESGGTRCYSESRSVADLVPSVKVYQMETPPALQAQSGCFPVISDEPKMPEDDTEVELVCEDKESQVHVTEKLSSANHAESLNSMDEDQRLGQHGIYSNKSAYVNELYNTEWFSDHMYCTVCPLVEEAIEDNGNSSVEAEANSQEVVQSPNRATEKPQDDCAGEMSNDTSESQSVGRPEPGSHSICFFDCRLTEEMATVDYLTSGDAVVPGELSPSLNTRDDLEALNDTDRSSPLSEEPDSFQRIHLSLSNGCSSVDSAGDVVMTNKHEAILKEEEQTGEEGEELQYQKTSMANAESERSASSHDEDQDLTKPGAAALRQADRHTACCSPGSSFSLVDVQDDLDPHASDSNHLPTWEMKKHFDMVLRELNLYFAISMNDFTSYTCKESFPEQLRDVTEATESTSSSCTNEELSCRRLKDQRDTLLGK